MSFLFLNLSVILLFAAYCGRSFLVKAGISVCLFCAFLFLLIVSHYVGLTVSVGWIELYPIRMAAVLLLILYFLSEPMAGWMRYRAVVGAFLFAVLLFFVRRELPEAVQSIVSGAPYLVSGAAAAISFTLCRTPTASVGCCALSLFGMEAAFALADHAVFGGTVQMFAEAFCPILLTALLLNILLNDAFLFLCPEDGAEPRAA